MRCSHDSAILSFHDWFPPRSTSNPFIRGRVPTVPLFLLLVVLDGGLGVIRTWTIDTRGTLGTLIDRAVSPGPVVGTYEEHTWNKLGTDQFSLRYRHSRRAPWRSR